MADAGERTPQDGLRGAAAASPVRGERGSPSITRALSIQSRVSNFLALGLMLAMGLGTLSWYYWHTATQRQHARLTAQAAAADRAQGEMALPALGPLEPPQLPPTRSAPNEATGATPDLVPPGAPSATSTPPLAAASSSASAAVPGTPVYWSGAGGYTAPVPKTARQLALERRLSGVAFARASPGEPTLGEPPAAAPADAVAEAATAKSSTPRAPAAGSQLAALLAAPVTPAVRARILPTQRLLLPKGAFIDCTLETAIDSTLPGMTTCVTATDTFSVDGQVVLLERGTKLVGETRGQVQQGAARVFVLWTEARTPSGVVVPLDSPGADELGRSGLPGSVDRHFWERFGAAILISTLDGAVQSAVQSSNRGSVILNPSASQDVMTEVLKSTLSIAPTVVKHNGDRIQVLVARDLDFRSVYELRSATAKP